MFYGDPTVYTSATNPSQATMREYSLTKLGWDLALRQDPDENDSLL